MLAAYSRMADLEATTASHSIPVLARLFPKQIQPPPSRTQFKNSTLTLMSTRGSEARKARSMSTLKDIFWRKHRGPEIRA
jgi:hypothetical protein